MKLMTGICRKYLNSLSNCVGFISYLEWLCYEIKCFLSLSLLFDFQYLVTKKKVLNRVGSGETNIFLYG